MESTNSGLPAADMSMAEKPVITIADVGSVRRSESRNSGEHYTCAAG